MRLSNRGPSAGPHTVPAGPSMTNEHEDSVQLAVDARRLIASFDSVLMSTVGADGGPHASYAPTVATEDGCFYVYTSGLSRHTTNLLENGLVSILFIENECDSKQAFARRRVNFDCQAEVVERESAAWGTVLDRFKTRFGDVLDLIRPLSDFSLFRLVPRRGTYVRGFGQAYRIDGARVGSLQHIGPDQLGGARD